MKGWQRLGGALLLIWWALCGVYIYDGYSQSTEMSRWNGLDEAAATRMMLNPDLTEPERALGREFLKWHDMIGVGAIAAIAVPLLVAVVFFTIRWISKGSKPGL